MEAVNFIDEQYVLLVKVGQDGGQVSGTFYGGTGCYPDAAAHLGGDDVGQRGLAQAGRAIEQDVVQGFAPSLGGGNGNVQVVLDGILPDEVAKRPGP
jgi:hypothetical protein